MREELRVPGLPEPISHYTDAVRAGDLLFVSGIVPVDGDRRRPGRSRRSPARGVGVVALAPAGRARAAPP